MHTSDTSLHFSKGIPNNSSLLESYKAKNYSDNWSISMQINYSYVNIFTLIHSLCIASDPNIMYYSFSGSYFIGFEVVLPTKPFV